MAGSTNIMVASQAAVEYAVITAGRALQSARAFLAQVIDWGSEHWGVIAVGVVVLVVFALFRNMSAPTAR